MNLRVMTRDLLRRVGLDLRRYRPLARDGFAVQRSLLGDSCHAVFDVGAFQGDTVAQYAAIFPAAKVYAFEPFPPTYRALSNRFNGDSRVRLVNAAVSSSAGDATFHVNRIPSTNSLLARPTAGRRYFPRDGATCESITVPTITLDGFCTQEHVGPPDILKMDIQGNELEACRGAEQLLRSGQVALIYTEVTFVPHYEGGVLFHELHSFLNQWGYTLFSFYDLNLARMGQLRFGDALFVSDALRRSVIDRLPEEP